MSHMHDFQWPRSEWTDADLVADEPELEADGEADPDEGADADGFLNEDGESLAEELDEDPDESGDDEQDELNDLFASQLAPKKRGPKPKAKGH